MSNNEKIRFDDGCWIIPEKEFKLILKNMAVITGAMGNLPQKELKEAIKEEMEELNLTEMEFTEFMILLLELLKTELEK